MKTEPDDASISSPKKARFVPKIPLRKRPKSLAAKGDKSGMGGNVIDKELLAGLNRRSEGSFGSGIPKTDRTTAPVQVAFGRGSTSMIRSFGNPKSAVDESKREVLFSFSEGSDVPVAALKEFVEPWDYGRNSYPSTLPLRRPYSGDPQILDREEFGIDAVSGINKPSVRHAEELGLMEARTPSQMFLFQFPGALPSAEQPSAGVDSKRSSDKQDTDIKSTKGCSLKDLSAGFLGKLMVHKSGKVKMKIGEALFDVSPGLSCISAEEFAVMNVREKHCCILGDLPKRAVVTPDVDFLLENPNPR